MSFHLACLMMIKNEEDTIISSLISVKNYIQSLIIYDTGSTDNTIKLITDFCEQNNLILRLKEEEFINFGESRNRALQFAESFDNIDYLLLMDANDILDNGETLLKLCADKKDSKETGFYLVQQWHNSNTNTNNTYYNIRLIKLNRGWRYIGSVHEYINNDNEIPERNDYHIVLKQERSKEIEKSFRRLRTDKQILLQSLEIEPNNSRNIFYLAQTCYCLKEYDDAFKNYLLRTTLNSGFLEEIFYSFMRCGDIIAIQGGNWNDSMTYYMKAYELEQRAEPLVRIAQYYITKEKWLISYSFLSVACRLEYPINSMLFVDKNVYDYYRWHLLGGIALYCGQSYKEEGKQACIKAIKCMNRDIDKNNLKSYSK